MCKSFRNMGFNLDELNLKVFTFPLYPTDMEEATRYTICQPHP